MSTREEERTALAAKLCKLPYSQLMKWDVSRVADITGLDVIGLPVHVAVRPPGEVITVSSGKGLDHLSSKAGAILESVELWAAENPDAHEKWMHCSHATATSVFENVLPFHLFQLARDAPVTIKTVLPWDPMDDVLRDRTIYVPSDMVWLKPRIKPPFQFFQSSTSGLASGIDVQDAMLSGLYEVVERDGWAISEFVQENSGQWRECISLDCPLPPEIQTCVDLLRKAGVHVFLFDLTTDLAVPTFRCTILDLNPTFPGAFSGFGCSLDPVTAARRAITEACQGRAVYIGGGRDDLMRRRFLLLKNSRMDTLLGMYQALPMVKPFSSYLPVAFNNIQREWDSLITLLQANGIHEIYAKTLYTCPDPEFSIVKVICPEMDCPLFEGSTPGKRSVKALRTRQYA